ncbi:MAG: VOC family protein [Leptolyngbya sp. SIO4C1]|nr:VOC family protein [Leptolyngbya sp. SIO4C1]
MASQAQSSSQVQAVQAVGMTVSNIEQATQFYTGAFTFEKVSDITVSGEAYDYLLGVFGSQLRIVTLKLGQETLRLMEYISPKGRPAPVDSQSHDLWFQHFAIIVSDLDRAYDRLKQFSFTPISTALQTIPESNEASAGIRAYKFKDADGHNLEILQFPPDKGADRWHQSTDNLFLGIDHSAISVSSTQQSLTFYRDLLGLSVGGGSLNTGKTQEYLDNLFAAKVQVTSLEPAQGGLGVELLDYLTPPGGRPMPVDQRSNDLTHVQLELVVNDLAAAVEALSQQAVQFVSPRVIELTDAQAPFRKGALIRDPDGHSLLLVENR